MKASFNASLIRDALREVLTDTDQRSAIPNLPPQFSYVPQSHALALDPDISIVSGIRGAGKSFWWTRLGSPEHKAYLSGAFPEIGKIDENEISQGFGDSRSEYVPSPEG